MWPLFETRAEAIKWSTWKPNPIVFFFGGFLTEEIGPLGYIPRSPTPTTGRLDGILSLEVVAATREYLPDHEVPTCPPGQPIVTPHHVLDDCRITDPNGGYVPFDNHQWNHERMCYVPGSPTPPPKPPFPPPPPPPTSPSPAPPPPPSCRKLVFRQTSSLVSGVEDGYDSDGQECDLVNWLNWQHGSCGFGCVPCKPAWLISNREDYINKGYPSEMQYSVLPDLGNAEYKDVIGDQYFFELYWEDLENTVQGPRQMWKQPNNPMVDSTLTTAELASKYEAVDTPYTTKWRIETCDGCGWWFGLVKGYREIFQGTKNIDSAYGVGSNYVGYPEHMSSWGALIKAAPFGKLWGPIDSDGEIILVNKVELWVHAAC